MKLRTNQKKQKSGEQNCRKKKLLNIEIAPQIGSIFVSCKIPEFFKKSPLPEAKKHPDFQVTACLHFVTTIVDFAYIKSEYAIFNCVFRLKLVG